MKPAGELAARTLLISEIPKHQCNVDQLTEYFKCVYEQNEKFQIFSIVINVYWMIFLQRGFPNAIRGRRHAGV